MSRAGRLRYATPWVILVAAAAAFADLVWPSAQRAGAAATSELVCPGVELAPRLASDRGTPATQTLDARGRYVPIVMVHGYTSKATHTRARTGTFSHLIDLSTTVGERPPAPRSLIGQLQKLPGAAVFTFDYHDDSANWVDHVKLGPALATAIDCLHDKGGHEKVIVVGHSMGGLIARYALGSAEGGDERAKRVSTVVTFGTPQSGSLVADLVAGVIDAGSVAGNDALMLTRLILAYCGTKSNEKLKTGNAVRHPAGLRAGLRQRFGPWAAHRVTGAQGPQALSSRRDDLRGDRGSHRAEGA